MRRSNFLILAAILISVVPLRASAQQVARSCQFIRDFKRLHDLAPETIGNCISRRLFQPNGDVLQYTANGVIVRRKADNWTAFTDGRQTFINGPRGLVSRPNGERFPWEHSAEPSPRPEAPEGTVRLGPASAYPNSALTPGATDPRVKQRNVKRTICSDDYLAKARPSDSYVERLKARQIGRYKYPDATPSAYEEDHLVPIELGGDPDAPSNMWPQAYSPAPGASEKDRVEAYLHDEVCAGHMTLAAAQQALLNDWVAVYQKISTGEQGDVGAS